MIFLRKVPYSLLAPAAILFALAPFSPQPHLFEKLLLLLDGELSRPLDMFDLLLHVSPALLLVCKLFLATGKQASG